MSSEHQSVKFQKDQNKIAVLLAKKQFNKAKGIAETLLKKHPNTPHLINLLGVALINLNRFDDAKRVLLTGLKTEDPIKKAYICNSLSQMYRKIDGEMALKYQQKAVKLNPIPEHLANLAKIELVSGLTENAVVNAKSAVLKKPEYQNGWEALCYILNELGRYSESLEYCKSELPLNSPKRCQLLIDAYVGLNDPENAMRVLKTLTSFPSLSDVHMEYCFNFYNILGFPEEAKSFVKTIKPKEFAFKLLLQLKANILTEAELFKVTQEFNSFKIGSVLKRRIAFAIAGNYKKNDKTKWFAWLRKANAIVPKGYEYDEQEVLTCFKKAQDFNFNKIPSSPSQSKTPIFILGMPRSGTTLTESILGAHSKCFACGESPVLESVLVGKNVSPGHGKLFSFIQKLDGINVEHLSLLSSSYLNKLRVMNSKAEFLIDKMPHNFAFTGVIPKLFPNAKIIHIQRNPIANILSLFEQDFTSFHSYSNSIDTLIRYYHIYQQYMEKMKAYVPEKQLYQLSYDSLASNPEKQVRSLLDFCELSFEESCMKFQEQSRTVRTSSRHQVRQGFYTSSLKPWEGLEEQLADLLEAFPDAH